MVLINDPADGLLKSPGVFLSSGGVGSGGPAYELAPGEGLGGAAFVAERAEVWPTTLSASMAQASLREANRVRLRRSKLGFIRSAIGAPLRVDGTAIGAILLTSERQENAWADVRRADHRSTRRRGRSGDRACAPTRGGDGDGALLDAVTGMATRPHLLAVIDKELARASRRESTLALIMADIDGFGELNDRFGHDTGNQRARDLRRACSGRSFGARTALRASVPTSSCASFLAPIATRRAAVAARIQQRFTADTSGDQGLGRSGATASAGIAVYPADCAGRRRPARGGVRASSTRPRHRTS